MICSLIGKDDAISMDGDYLGIYWHNAVLSEDRVLLSEDHVPCPEMDGLALGRCLRESASGFKNFPKPHPEGVFDPELAANPQNRAQHFK